MKRRKDPGQCVWGGQSGGQAGGAAARNPPKAGGRTGRRAAWKSLVRDSRSRQNFPVVLPVLRHLFLGRKRSGLGPGTGR